ncbi:proepiregulin-like [Clinocottus analis]|uniref:proepiregulin-like n=1 Tax=Clinocottus analis TaxID=304258 RepID=UPI0035BED3EE
MGNNKPLALLSLIGVMLLWPSVLTRSLSSGLQAAGSASLSAGPAAQRPLLVRRSVQNCDSSFDSYCMNSGQCLLLLDLNEHHCKCVRGFYGPRCSQLELVVQPVAEEQLVVILFCAALLVLGLSGVLYFCCKWHKKNKFPCQPKRQGYKGVQTA